MYVYCASMCVCMYVWICVHACVAMYLYMYVNCVCVYVYGICVSVYTYMWIAFVCLFVVYVFVYICAYVCVCVYMSVCECIYLWVCVQTYAHACVSLPPRLWKISFWANCSVLLSQPKSACNRRVALHLPIVRKSWPGAIVLKQKSIAFGSCPRKFNELIFKAPFSLQFDSVTPQARHTDLQVGSHTAPAPTILKFLPAPPEGPEPSMRKSSMLEPLHTTALPTLSGAKRHGTGFPGEERPIPLLLVRGQCPYWISWFLDFLKGDPSSLSFPNVEAERMGSSGSLGRWLQDAWVREEEDRRGGSWGCQPA